MLLEGTDQEVRDWLTDRNVDLGVVAELCHDTTGTGVGPLDDAVGAVLARDRLVAVLDPGHPLASQPAVTLDDLADDLADDAFLLSDGGCEPILRRLHELAGLRLRPARRIRDMATLLAMVRERLGVTVVPELALPDAHQLAVVPLAPQVHLELRLLAADEHDLPTAGHALLETARQRGASVSAFR